MSRLIGIYFHTLTRQKVQFENVLFKVLTLIIINNVFSAQWFMKCYVDLSTTGLNISIWICLSHKVIIITLNEMYGTYTTYYTKSKR